MSQGCVSPEGLGPGEFEQFLELTHDGVWRYDIKPSVSTKLPAREQAAAILERARFGFCNAALAQVVGLSGPLDLIGRPLTEFLASDDDARIELVASSVADGYRVRELEAPVRHVDGRIVWTRSNIVGIVRRGRLSSGWGTTRDVTEQKAAEAALREAHANLNATIAAFPDLVFEVDGRGRILQYHAPDPSQLYTSPDAFLGRSVADVLPPDAARAILDALRVAVATGSQRGARYSLDIGGEKRWFDLSIAVRGEERGEEGRYVAIARDVTPAEAASAALRVSEERLALALDATSDGIYDADLAAGVTTYSPGYAVMLGYEPDELPPGQETWKALLHPEDRDRAVATLDACVAGGADEYEMEFRLRTKAGDWRWILSRGRAVARDARGRALRIVGTHRDITPRVLAREELRRERDLAQLYLDTAQAILIVLDPAGRVRLVNRRGCELLGCEAPSDLIGRDWFSSCLPERIAAATAEVFRELMAGRIAGAEYHENPVRTASGGERLIAWHNAILRDAGTGEIAGIVSSGQDITDRRAAEDARRESEERFRRIFEESPIGMVTAGPDYRFTSANAAFCRMLGYSEDELRLLRFTDITHPEYVTADLAGVDLAVRGMASAYRTEKRYVRKDGGVVWGALSSVPIRDAAGKVQHFLAMIADVTAEKEASAALAESERRFRDLANALPTCVFETDLDGRITYANQTGLSWFGYSEAEMLGKPPVAEMVVPGQREKAARTLRRAAERGEVPAGEYTAMRKDGTTFPALVSSRALVRDGETVGVRGILIDISERVESARRLERALSGTIHALAVTTEMRDPFTAGHQERVTRLAVAMGQHLGLPEAQLEGLRVAGLLHDVGKVSVPAEILSKPTSLNPIEMGLVRAHPETGHAILREIDFPWPVAEIVLQHHERMDGSGYPKGIQGDAILVEARILAVADTVEAMASHRPYRAAHSLREALDEIERGRGVTYDDQAARACAHVFDDGFRLDA